MSHPLNKYSARITQPKSQGASQAMLYATGLTESDMNKAQVGIASVWFEGNPCNMHLLGLAEKVKEGVDGATDLIRKYPIPALLVGFGVGLLIGRMLRG